MLAEDIFVELSPGAMEVHAGGGGTPMELAEEKWGPDPRATSWEARCPPRREEGVEGTGQSRERGGRRYMGGLWSPEGTGGGAEGRGPAREERQDGGRWERTSQPAVDRDSQAWNAPESLWGQQPEEGPLARGGELQAEL